MYQYFEIGPRQNWFISRFLQRCSIWCSTDSCGQISFITFWLFVFISPYLSIKNQIFRTLLTLHNYIYQMRKRNIMKFCLHIPKHLVTQLAKLHVDICNLNNTFRHFKKKFRLLLNKGVPLRYNHPNTVVCLYLPMLPFSVPEVVSVEFKFLHFRHAISHNRRLQIWYGISMVMTRCCNTQCQTTTLQCHTRRMLNFTRLYHCDTITWFLLHPLQIVSIRGKRSPQGHDDGRTELKGVR